MGIRLIKKNGKSYIQLPDEFNQLDEVDLFHLKENFWLVSPVLVKEAKLETKEEKHEIKEEKKLSEAEKVVLHKLMKIRFADRTPSNIEKTFSADEKGTVRQLIKKGFVQVFYGKKYEKTGVYSISDEIYPFIGHDEAHPEQQQKGAPNQRDVTVSQATPPAYSELAKTGWMIIPNPRDAEQFSFELKRSGLSQQVKGVRGFDGKFYVATNRFLYAAYEKIKSVLEKKKEMLVEEIARASGIDADGVAVVMRILSESGEVIEKRRGLFCLA